MAVPSPTQSQVQTAVVSFLAAILPSGIPIVQGQDNRVAEPDADDFCVLWVIRRNRIETNIDSNADVRFTGSIVPITGGTGVMTVTAVQFGSISPGATVFGVGVAAGTIVAQQNSGTPGGVGTYAVTVGQTILSETLSSGATSITQNTEIVYQIDVHGPNSPDNAQVITTVWRDAWGVDYFADYTEANALAGSVAPLHADDPKQVPFINAENQYETRWIVEAHLQANQIVSLPLQYADVVDITLKDVDVLFPPT
jgi:hypothetical protein